jgi:hypothetical protein
MKKFLKWVGIVLGALVGMILVSLVVIYFKTQARLTRVYDLPEEPVSIPQDSASIERGRHIFQFRGCQACHSEGGYVNVSEEGQPLNSHLNLPSQDIPHLEGNIYLDDPAIGKVVASNLTSGKGGVAGNYTDRLGVPLTWHRADALSAVHALDRVLLFERCGLEQSLPISKAPHRGS